MSKETLGSSGKRSEQPIGARGFPGHGSEEGKRATLFDLYKPGALPTVAYTLSQLPNEAEWLNKGGSFSPPRDTALLRSVQSPNKVAK